MATKDEIMEYVIENNVEFIRLWFTDINGLLKGFAITHDELENALNRRMGFDGSSITGFQDIEESNMIAMPTLIHSPCFHRDLKNILWPV